MTSIKPLKISGEHYQSRFFATDKDAVRFYRKLESLGLRPVYEYMSLQFDDLNIASHQCCRLMGIKGLYRISLLKVPA